MTFSPEWFLTALFVPAILYLFHKGEKSQEQFIEFLREERQISTKALEDHTNASRETHRLMEKLMVREEQEIALLEAIVRREQ